MTKPDFKLNFIQIIEQIYYSPAYLKQDSSFSNASFPDMR